MWNRIRYTFWAPWYDTLVAAADFAEARRQSIQGLCLQPGARVGPGPASISSACREA